MQAVVGDIVADDLDALETWCAQELRALYGTLPPSLLSRAASRALVSGAEGFAVAGKRVLRVSRGGVPAREVDPAVAALVGDPSSLYYATARSPVFFERVDSTATRLYVKPDPTTTAKAQVDHLAYPEDGEIDPYTTTYLEGLPVEADEAFVLGVGSRALTAALAEARAALPDLAEATGSLPDPPDPAEFPTRPDLDDALKALESAIGNLGDSTLTVPHVPAELTVPAITVDLGDALTDLEAAVAPGKEDPELADAALRRVNAALAEFKAEVEAYATAERAQMDRFASQVQAYAAEARALLDRYGAVVEARTGYPRMVLERYAAEVQAEAARARSEADVFASRFQAYATEAQAHVARHAAALQRTRADLEAIAVQLRTVEARYARALQRLTGSPAPVPAEA